ncbi:hypothetical protein MTR67_002070 [Solanum verrucosum]|uniref:Uncharacterized protein n=1 Tax=Solanum verrucosum TaxID=315347 RepID=A0AAF0PSZ9_SOLVR|nr:hypothetical protein MTR67_002070 [Solanum verrucosum]
MPPENLILTRRTTQLMI